MYRSLEKNKLKNKSCRGNLLAGKMRMVTCYTWLLAGWMGLAMATRLMLVLKQTGASHHLTLPYGFLVVGKVVGKVLVTMTWRPSKIMMMIWLFPMLLLPAHSVRLPAQQAKRTNPSFHKSWVRDDGIKYAHCISALETEEVAIWDSMLQMIPITSAADADNDGDDADISGDIYIYI